MQDLILKHLRFFPPFFPPGICHTQEIKSVSRPHTQLVVLPFGNTRAFPALLARICPCTRLLRAEAAGTILERDPSASTRSPEAAGTAQSRAGERHREKQRETERDGERRSDPRSAPPHRPRPPPPARTPGATPRSRARSRRGRAGQGRPRCAPPAGSPGPPPPHSPAAHVRGRAGRAERRERYCRGPAPGACAIQTPPHCMPGRARRATPRRARRAAPRRPLPAASSRPAPPASPRARAASGAGRQSREGARDGRVIPSPGARSSPCPPCLLGRVNAEAWVLSVKRSCLLRQPWWLHALLHYRRTTE